MKLRLTGLNGFVALEEEVVALRAEDASGRFGIHNGYADFLTVLSVGVISWRDSNQRERHCAVRRGVMRVTGGNTIDIASREAIVDDDLEKLESTVLAEFRRREEDEHRSRTETHRLELQALREIMRYLQPQNLFHGGRGR